MVGKVLKEMGVGSRMVGVASKVSAGTLVAGIFPSLSVVGVTTSRIVEGAA